ncbi:hypothetical protein [Leptolyngbya sp. FACHB-17]|nr:hypothetical protein [Leptolyngbya sp. FACHB-17]
MALQVYALGAVAFSFSGCLRAVKLEIRQNCNEAVRATSVTQAF